ncbi:MAG: VWA domain-containing protein [Myxococcales bacterium]|nr:VWA domain-containing protein [Myxococcales bacterium]
MVFTGLSLMQVLAVLGLASAFTIAMYMLRQRRRPVPVPFVGLWEQVLGDSRSNRLFSSLRHLLSLLLSLCIVGALALAIGDPRPEGFDERREHLVILLDMGASMAARDVEPSRFGAALEVARAHCRSAGPGRAVLLASYDSAPTPRTPMVEDPQQLERALEALTPGARQSDHDAALRFALDVLRGKSRPRVLLLSDRARLRDDRLGKELERAGIEVQHRVFGTRGRNLAITAFSARRYPLERNQSELWLEIINTSERKQRVELQLLGDGQPIDAESLEIDARGRVRRVYDDITGVSQSLEARLLHPDAKGDDLALDDRRHALLPERRRSRVLCVTAGNRYLEAALLLDEYLDVDLVHPEAYAGTEGYDAAIFDATLPPEAPSVDSLYIHPAPSAAGVFAPFEVLGEAERPFFDRIDHKHPWLRHTALRDVNVGRALRLKLAPGDRAIAGSGGVPLLVSGERAGKKMLAIAFDIRDSDLPLRVAWPLLLLNGIDLFSTQRDDYRDTHHVGRFVELEVPEGDKRASLRTPSGSQRELVTANGRTGFMAEAPGFYELQLGDRRQLLAVNLEPGFDHELTPSGQLQLTGRTVPTPARKPTPPGEPPWALLAALALGLSMLEWITFHRRWTL